MFARNNSQGRSAAWSRRRVLHGAGALGAAIAIGRPPATAAQAATPTATAPAGLIKLVILYNPPADPAAFDDYYLTRHLPRARLIPGYLRLELAKVVATADGKPAPYHRVSELLFPDLATMTAALGSAEGQAALADQANFAQAGAVALITAVDVNEGPLAEATPVP